MLSELDIEAAHPDAFDFVFGNLPSAKRADFNRHLVGCRYCQAVVDEYSEIGGIIQQLPPHADPPGDLEDRTVAAMVAALADRRASTDRRSDAEDQAATRAYPIPQPSADPETRLHPRPPNQAPVAGAAPTTGTGRTAIPAAGHSPACVAAPPSPPSSCACGGCRPDHRRCRCRTSASWRPEHPGPSHSRSPAPCHRCGQADRRRGRYGTSNGSPGWPKLDLRYDRARTQGASRQ